MADTLLVAAIAAAAALLGSAVAQLGPLIQHWLSARQERRAMLRAKYEQMATLASELTVHLALRLDAPAHSQDSVASREILHASTQMHTLALLYFPELLPPVEAYRHAALRADGAIARGGFEDTKAAASAFAEARGEILARVMQHASKYA